MPSKHTPRLLTLKMTYAEVIESLANDAKDEQDTADLILDGVHAWLTENAPQELHTAMQAARLRLASASAFPKLLLSEVALARKIEGE